jgi:hypothetical protein
MLSRCTAARANLPLTAWIEAHHRITIGLDRTQLLQMDATLFRDRLAIRTDERRGLKEVRVASCTRVDATRVSHTRTTRTQLGDTLEDTAHRGDPH